MTDAPENFWDRKTLSTIANTEMANAVPKIRMVPVALMLREDREETTADFASLENASTNKIFVKSKV